MNSLSKRIMLLMLLLLLSFGAVGCEGGDGDMDDEVGTELQEDMEMEEGELDD